MKIMSSINGRFTIFDAAFIIFSMSTFLVDVITDLLVGIQYLLGKETAWGSLTLTFVLIPNIVMQVFSIRWYKADGEMSRWQHWLPHAILAGPLQRYIRVLQAGWHARSTQDQYDFALYYHRQNDVCMLRLFESFMESAPQLLLQLYIMVFTQDANWLTGTSASISLISLAWAIAAYTKSMRQEHRESYKVFWPGLILQTLWRMGMVSSRVICLVLFASAFKEWLFLVFGFHWLAMTVWIFFQQTDFTDSWCEERLFNVVAGVIYCFCFFNLKEGRTRQRMLIFYTVMFLENTIFLSLWYTYREPDIWYSEAVLGATASAFVVGLLCMMLYYRFCHPSGPITLCTGESEEECDSEYMDEDVYQQSELKKGMLKTFDPEAIRRRQSLKTGRNPYICKFDEGNQFFQKDLPNKDTLVITNENTENECGFQNDAFGMMLAEEISRTSQSTLSLKSSKSTMNAQLSKVGLRQSKSQPSLGLVTVAEFKSRSVENIPRQIVVDQTVNDDKNKLLGPTGAKTINTTSNLIEETANILNNTETSAIKCNEYKDTRQYNRVNELNISTLRDSDRRKSYSLNALHKDIPDKLSDNLTAVVRNRSMWRSEVSLPFVVDIDIRTTEKGTTEERFSKIVPHNSYLMPLELESEIKDCNLVENARENPSDRTEETVVRQETEKTAEKEKDGKSSDPFHISDIVMYSDGNVSSIKTPPKIQTIPKTRLSTPRRSALVEKFENQISSSSLERRYVRKARKSLLSIEPQIVKKVITRFDSCDELDKEN